MRTRRGALRRARREERRGRDVLVVALTADHSGRLQATVLTEHAWPARLRQIRKAFTWTQRRLADALGVGDCRLASWEQGRAAPHRRCWRTLLALEDQAAAVAGRTPEDLDPSCAAGPLRIVPSAAAFPDRVRRLRRRLGGISINQLAWRLGVASETVRAWERGLHAPQPRNRQAVLRLWHRWRAWFSDLCQRHDDDEAAEERDA